MTKSTREAEAVLKRAAPLTHRKIRLRVTSFMPSPETDRSYGVRTVDRRSDHRAEPVPDDRGQSEKEL